MKKGYVIALAIFAGFFVLVGIISAMGGDTESVKPAPAKEAPAPTVGKSDSIYKGTMYNDVADVEKSASEVYDAVQLGMTEDEVWAIAGRPEMTSQADVEEFGNVTNLVYSDAHSLDNVTVSMQDGVVKLIVLGEFDGEYLDVKSKM